MAVSSGSTPDLAPEGRADDDGPRRPVAVAGTVPSLRVPEVHPPVEHDELDELLDPGLLADLDRPDLVFSSAYVGPDRRRPGPMGRVRRSIVAHGRRRPRRALLVAAALASALVLLVAVLVAGSPFRTDSPRGALSTTTPVDHVVGRAAGPARAADRLPGTGAPAASGTGAGQPVPTTPTTVAPAASATPPAVSAAPAPVATSPTTTEPASSVGLTPDQLGAEALALVRYPWQSIPGYSIEFLPIADAPSAGFYGNTTFTWGKTGGTSVLYVYPGETASRLAAITAFEIGHEVDAAAVEPQGGEQQIEDVLGVHPASWAPSCDCAEQGYLSGWYAAAFSNFWSPGVGSWSTIAAEPTGATLAAVERWLDPSIP